VRASAIVVGARHGAGRPVYALAAAAGFRSVGEFSGTAAAARLLAETPVVFFLCAAVRSLAELRPAVEAVRFSSEPRLRLQPLIYVAAAPALDTIRACINFGFDDVIALPLTPARLRERLARQIDTPQIYFETADYFGPDRHNRGGGAFRRLEIRRSLADGISVLREDVPLVV
jgi:hypothetical protein